MPLPHLAGLGAWAILVLAHVQARQWERHARARRGPTSLPCFGRWGALPRTSLAFSLQCTCHHTRTRTHMHAHTYTHMRTHTPCGFLPPALLVGMADLGTCRLDHSLLSCAPQAEAGCQAGPGGPMSNGAWIVGTFPGKRPAQLSRPVTGPHGAAWEEGAPAQCCCSQSLSFFIWKMKGVNPP